VHPEVVFGLDQKLFTAAINNDPIINTLATAKSNNADTHSNNSVAVAGAGSDHHGHASFASDVDVLHVEWVTLAHSNTFASPSDTELLALLHTENVNGSIANTHNVEKTIEVTAAVKSLAVPLPYTDFKQSLDMLASTDVIRAKGVVYLSEIPSSELSFPENHVYYGNNEVTSFTGAVLLNWAFGKYTLIPVAIRRHNPDTQNTTNETSAVIGTLPKQTLTSSALFNQYSGLASTHSSSIFGAGCHHNAHHTRSHESSMVEIDDISCIHSRLTLFGVSIAGTMLPFKVAKALRLRKLAKPYVCSDSCCNVEASTAAACDKTHEHKSGDCDDKCDGMHCGSAGRECCSNDSCTSCENEKHDHSTSEMKVISPAQLVSLVNHECVRPGIVVGVSGSHAH